ncbi:MAG: tRNA (N6-threonylcarbamoyladenosine(37)-N6)-methyltransferase TrmO, partial [Candidatus Heimdallarchaeota archaeon]|nr:tRNA (N6-threonylcarbamoyladenosine(37)-N6)-methyltransferase TrmO [Candidatus Heimdallarchaeota archaeon]
MTPTTIAFTPIGRITTPYINSAPYQQVTDASGDFRITVNEEYLAGLDQLAKFRYIYVIYYLDRLKKRVSMQVNPSWTPQTQVGVFASRTPARPNPIGISVVQVNQIVGNEIHISGIDVFDGTPVLDIKPYIQDLDAKSDANYGWLEDLPDRDH